MLKSSLAQSNAKIAHFGPLKLKVLRVGKRVLGKDSNIADACRRIYEVIENRSSYAETNAKLKAIVEYALR